MNILVHRPFCPCRSVHAGKFLALGFLQERPACNLTLPIILPRGCTSLHSNQQCARAKFMVVVKLFAHLIGETTLF